MSETTYGTGTTGFSDGSTRLVSTLKKKKSRVRKKYKRKRKK